MRPPEGEAALAGRCEAWIHTDFSGGAEKDIPAVKRRFILSGWYVEVIVGLEEVEMWIDIDKLKNTIDSATVIL